MSLTTSLLPIQIADPGEAFCPATARDLVNQLQNIAVAVQKENLGAVFSSTEPGPELRDKAWIRTDSDGRPIGTHVYYAGQWRKDYAADLGETRWFHTATATSQQPVIDAAAYVLLAPCWKRFTTPITQVISGETFELLLYKGYN